MVADEDAALVPGMAMSYMVTASLLVYSTTSISTCLLVVSWMLNNELEITNEKDEK